MIYTPDYMREIITDNVADLQIGKVDDNFQSLMNYIDLDTLVAWFVEYMCENDPHYYMENENDADAVCDWYQKHCQ